MSSTSHLRYRAEALRRGTDEGYLRPPKRCGIRLLELACSAHDLQPSSGAEEPGIWRLEAARVISKFTH